MSVFHYRAYTSRGDLLEGDVEAASLVAAENLIWSRGLTPFETREIKSGTGPVWRNWFVQTTPSLPELASFTREFAALKEADIPVDRALRILEEQNTSTPVRRLIGELLARILDGASLSQALAERPHIFPFDYINMVRAGEATGQLGAAFSDLADLLEQRVELRARLRSILVYPSLLIVLALASTAIVLGTLAPSIAPLFQESGRPMPSGLAFVIRLGEASPFIAAGIGVLGLGLFALKRWLAQNVQARMSVDAMKLRLPVVGPMIASHEVARFTRGLGAMLRCGVPMLSALSAARLSFSNSSFGAEVDAALENVRGGETLSVALAKVKHFPLGAIQIIAVGEEARKLDVMLLRVAVMFERQNTRRLERAMGLLTPALTILIAVFVGGLILSVMNAVLGINELAIR